MYGQKNGYGAALNAARALSECGAVGRHERVVAPYLFRLTRLSTGEVRLVVAHQDRVPSYDEANTFTQAAGGPVDCEMTRTVWIVATQDGIQKQLPAVVAGWREY